MRKTTGLTQNDWKHIQCQCRSISKLEDNVSDKEIRQMLYTLGVYAYRQFHKQGLPVDMKQPRLSSPKKVWSSVMHKHVDERIIEILEAEYIRNEEEVALAA